LNQPYFIVVLAHSLHGRLRRIQIPYQFVYLVLVLAVIGGISVMGFVTSYMRMTLKVANYNRLRQEVDILRLRYHNLEKESRNTHQQLASLQNLATEVSVAYGLKRQVPSSVDLMAATHLAPTVRESFDTFNFLKSASLSRYARSAPLYQPVMLPSIWPVTGALMSHFGNRMDPFSGEGAFHTGVDIQAKSGTPVHATGDGIVALAEYSGRYGKLVIVDHGNGIETYYAHLSSFSVVEGQSIRRADLIGFSGATGRVTSAHLHYEIRRGGAPVNPSQYLHQSITQPTRREFLF
jgi:murein DD-endopeptidase MepM/ murein hydrolase activator NlpD